MGSMVGGGLSCGGSAGEIGVPPAAGQGTAPRRLWSAVTRHRFCAGDLSPSNSDAHPASRARAPAGASRERPITTSPASPSDGDQSPRKSGDQSPQSKNPASAALNPRRAADCRALPIVGKLGARSPTRTPSGFSLNSRGGVREARAHPRNRPALIPTTPAGWPHPRDHGQSGAGRTRPGFGDAIAMICSRPVSTRTPAEERSRYLFSAKGADLSQPGATPQETSHVPFER